MAHRRYFVTEAGRYGTRMLQAGQHVQLSGPEARLFTALGRVSAKRPVKDAAPVVQQPVDDLKALRAAYRAKFGKGPGPSWDAATIRAKIAAA